MGEFYKRKDGGSQHRIQAILDDKSYIEFTAVAELLGEEKESAFVRKIIKRYIYEFKKKKGGLDLSAFGKKKKIEDFSYVE